jgi:hypothetical protein
MLYSTYFGGNAQDYANSMALDDAGHIFFTGTTRSANFPVTPGSFDTSIDNPPTAFVVRLDPAGGGLSDRVWATYLGGTSDDYGTGIELDESGNLVLTGYTASTDFPQYPLGSPGSNYDIYITSMLPDGANLSSSQLVGGGVVDNSWAMTLGPGGDIHVAGQTSSSDYPTTPGAYLSARNGMTDAFVTRLSPLGGIEVNSSRMMGNGTVTDVAYARYREYTFRVRVYDSESIDDIDRVVLRLDPGRSDIALKYTPSTGAFIEASDALDAVEIHNTSKVLHSGYATLTLLFNVTFNWLYPHEEMNNVSVRAVGKALPDAWHNLTDVFRVENDLTLKGSLQVQAEDDRFIYNKRAVRGGEPLRWSGLTPIYQDTTVYYPHEEEFNITLSNSLGESWTCSPEPGEEMYIGMNVTNITHTGTSGGVNYTINITVIPPECDGSDHHMTLYVDGDNVTFSSPGIGPDEWQRKRSLGVSVAIHDIGDAGVDGDSVRCSWSTDGGTNWRAWEPVYGTPPGTTVQAEHEVDLWDGDDNLVRWRASDTLGNGPTESPAYPVLVARRCRPPGR